MDKPFKLRTKFRVNNKYCLNFAQYDHAFYSYLGMTQAKILFTNFTSDCK